MKKFLPVIFSMLIVFFLTGCNNQLSSSGDNHNHATNYVTNSLASETPKDPTKGEINGNVYKNAYLNLTLTKPDGWEFLPQDAVKIQGEEFDMMAVDHRTNGSIYIAFENLTATAGKTLTAKEYVTDVLQAALEYSPYSTFIDESEITIGGNTYIKVTIEIQDKNNPLTKYVYLRGVDDYMVQIYATVPSINAELIDFDSMLS